MAKPIDPFNPLNLFYYMRAYMSGHNHEKRRIDIRITDYEVCQLEAASMRRGMNKSELIRSLIAQFPAPPKAE